MFFVEKGEYVQMTNFSISAGWLGNSSVSVRKNQAWEGDMKHRARNSNHSQPNLANYSMWIDAH
jgi:hypothetical protein